MAKLPDSDSSRDFTVLKSSEKQKKGLDHISKMLSEDLDIDFEVIRAAFDVMLIKMQISEGRFHQESETLMPQDRLFLIKTMEPKVIATLRPLLPKYKEEADLIRASDRVFKWYISGYLGSN